MNVFPNSDDYAPSGNPLSIPPFPTSVSLSKGGSSGIDSEAEFCALHPEIRVFKTFNEFYSFLGNHVLVRVDPSSNLPLRYIVLEAYFSSIITNKETSAGKAGTPSESPSTGGSSAYGSMPSLVSSPYSTPEPGMNNAADLFPHNHHFLHGPFLPGSLPLPTEIPTRKPNGMVSNSFLLKSLEQVRNSDLFPNNKTITNTQPNFPDLDLGETNLRHFGVTGVDISLSDYVRSLLQALHDDCALIENPEVRYILEENPICKKAVKLTKGCVYIDDQLETDFDKNPDVIKLMKKVTLKVLEELNVKTDLKEGPPKTKTKYLGWVMCAEELGIRLPGDKRAKLIRILVSVLEGNRNLRTNLLKKQAFLFSNREWSSMLGLLQFFVNSKPILKPTPCSLQDHPAGD